MKGRFLTGIIKETLRWCNERRAEKGLEPLNDLPKGHRNEPESCPCGAATGLWVGRVKWGADVNAAFNGESLPAAVSRFVVAFDGGELPEYDLDINTEGAS